MITLSSFDRTPDLAELKVSYRRRPRANSDTQIVIADSETCETYLRKIWNGDTLELREEFIVLCLNSGHHVLGWINVASGGLDAASVDPRIIFGVALQTASAAIILAHNHPSGSLKPSPQDIAMTQRLRDAGTLLSINVLDHLIITRDGYFSFADNAWMP